MAQVSDSSLLNTSGISQQDACVIIVRTDWNGSFVDELEKGCKHVLREHGINSIQVLRVPGAVEIPFAIQKYWSIHKYRDDRPQAFIALGCVLRGGTPHFEYVCHSVTDGITQLNLELPVPTVFGVLTLDTRQQAEERLGGSHGHKGEEAAITAIKMINLVRAISHQKSCDSE
jgi:6,7-dimethyl-8-ribityllumazine synthase